MTMDSVFRKSIANVLEQEWVGELKDVGNHLDEEGNRQLVLEHFEEVVDYGRWLHLRVGTFLPLVIV
jgi:hypothetical protein